MKTKGYQDNPYYELLILLVINAELVDSYLSKKQNVSSGNAENIIDKFICFKKLNDDAQKEIIIIQKLIRGLFDLEDPDPKKYYSILRQTLNDPTMDLFPTLFDLTAYQIKHKFEKKYLPENYQKNINPDIALRLNNFEKSFLFYRKNYGPIDMMGNFIGTIRGRNSFATYLQLLIESTISQNPVEIAQKWQEETFKPIHLAAAIGNKRLIKFFLSDENSNLVAYGFKPIHYACAYNPNPDVVFKLINRGVKLGVKLGASENGYSPFYLAAAAGKEEVLAYFLNKNIKKINHKNSVNKWTALHAASHNGHLHCVKLLLEKKADPYIFNSGDTTNFCKKLPVHLACQQNHFAIVVMFINLFPKLIDIPDGHGKTLFHYVCESGNEELIEYLSAIGADPLALTKKNEMPTDLLPTQHKNIKEKLAKKTPVLKLSQTQITALRNSVRKFNKIGIPILVSLIVFGSGFSILYFTTDATIALIFSGILAIGSALLGRHLAIKHLTNPLANYLLTRLAAVAPEGNAEFMEEESLKEIEESYSKFMLTMNMNEEHTMNMHDDHTMEITELPNLDAEPTQLHENGESVTNFSNADQANTDFIEVEHSNSSKFPK